MRRFIVTLFAGVALVQVPTAPAAFLQPPKPVTMMSPGERVRYFSRSWAHYAYVAAHGAPARRRHENARAARWAREELERARALLAPPRPPIDACTMQVIRNEGSGFDPDKRSTWRRAATRPNSHGSSAYGVPQALPGSKMAGYGADWATNPWTQIRWMIDYETQRYGSPCAALAWWNTHGWY